MKKSILDQRFNIFKAPVTNTVPLDEINILQAYELIRSRQLEQQTLHLRTITDKNQNRKYKSSYFPYCTFSGTFVKRKDNGLKRHSGLIAIDFDHVQDIDDLKIKLLADDYFETQLLFVSPNGNGLKWVVPIEINKYSHKEIFGGIYNNIKKRYDIEVDKACKDVSRATFLCHDPHALIHPKYLKDDATE